MVLHLFSGARLCLSTQKYFLSWENSGYSQSKKKIVAFCIIPFIIGCVHLFHNDITCFSFLVLIHLLKSVTALFSPWYLKNSFFFLTYLPPSWPHNSTTFLFHVERERSFKTPISQEHTPTPLDKQSRTQFLYLSCLPLHHPLHPYLLSYHQNYENFPPAMIIFIHYSQFKAKMQSLLV